MADKRSMKIRKCAESNQSADFPTMGSLLVRIFGFLIAKEASINNMMELKIG